MHYTRSPAPVFHRQPITLAAGYRKRYERSTPLETIRARAPAAVGKKVRVALVCGETEHVYDLPPRLNTARLDPAEFQRRLPPRA